MGFGGCLLLDSSFSDFLRTGALQNPPLLMQPLRRVHRVFDLITSGERTSIQENTPQRILSKQISCGLQHDLQAEVVLPGCIFNLVIREESVADFILAQQPTASTVGQFASERSLSSARKPGHEDDHFFIKARVTKAISCSESHGMLSSSTPRRSRVSGPRTGKERICRWFEFHCEKARRKNTKRP